MSYIALTRFADLRDENHIYEAGETYPRPGYVPTQYRIDELSGTNNRMGYPLIGRRVERAETPVEASESEPKEIPVKTAEAAKKPVRSRKKG